MSRQSFPAFLAKQLRSDALPGPSSQLKMAPYPVDKTAPTQPLPASPSAHASSVLILLLQNRKNQWELVLTVRSQYVSHPGQISFPGGRTEANESAVETALRETCEEIGVPSSAVTIIGKLSQLNVSHSNNVVQPVVGVLKQRSPFTANPAEVDEVFTITLDQLADEQNLTTEEWDLRRDRPFKVPYWKVHHVPLWGATAMILSEFMTFYRAYRKGETI